MAGRRWTPTLLFVAVAFTLLAGAVLAVLTIRDRPVGEATVRGLFLRLDRAEWLLDQMEHNENFPMPASMMPGMPPPGVFRLSVEVALHNPSDEHRAFRITELFFRSSERGMWPATSGELEDVVLAPGEALNMFTQFDVAESQVEGDLRLIWLRDGMTVQMLDIPHPPDHDHDEDEESGDFVWPADVAELSSQDGGDPQRGAELFTSTFGCIACHGEPGLADSHTVGPHLAGVGDEASRRAAGVSAEQYLYESIVAPDAFISDGCKTGPCDSPSAMPPFAELMTAQDMQDLVAYLLSL